MLDLAQSVETAAQAGLEVQVNPIVPGVVERLIQVQRLVKEPECNRVPVLFLKSDVILCPFYCLFIIGFTTNQQ